MYPFLRLPWQTWRHRGDPPLGPLGEHASRHVCWPWDLDFWMELNNGRTLTILDLGRVPMANRMGLTRALARRGWSMTVAGASVRYRRRVRAFDRIEMRSRGVGWDARFIYVEQAMWVRGECTSHALLRMAVAGPGGIVPPAEVMGEIGADPVSPPLPDWVAAWVAAEAVRPWPPMAAG
jgi:acyl-CoA thioesterase FadM